MFARPWRLQRGHCSLINPPLEGFPCLQQRLARMQHLRYSLTYRALQRPVTLGLRQKCAPTTAASSQLLRQCHVNLRNLHLISETRANNKAHYCGHCSKWVKLSGTKLRRGWLAVDDGFESCSGKQDVPSSTHRAMSEPSCRPNMFSLYCISTGPRQLSEFKAATLQASPGSRSQHPE